MGPEYFWMHGMWFFPMVIPVVMLIVMLVMLYLLFAKGSFKTPFQPLGKNAEGGPDSENPLDILNRRYARGDITREEYERIKRDILS